MSKAKDKLYYIRVSEHELNNIESEVRKYIIGMMTKEIYEHSKQLAVGILQGKGLIKKKWYELTPEEVINE